MDRSLQLSELRVRHAGRIRLSIARVGLALIALGMVGMIPGAEGGHCGQFFKAWGDYDDEAVYSATSTYDGGVAMCGYTESWGDGGKDILIVKFDGQGNLSWIKALGGSGDEIGRCIIETESNHLVVTGHTNSYPGGGYDNLLINKLSAAGSHLWSKGIHRPDGTVQFYGYSILEDLDNNELVVTGVMWRDLGTSERDNLLFAKFDSDGEPLLAQLRSIYSLLHPTWEHYGYSIVEKYDNDYLAVGELNTGTEQDILLVDFGPLGVEQWAWRFGPGNGADEVAWSIIRVSGSRYAMTGWVNSDLFLLKLQQNLDVDWGRRFFTNSSTGRAVTQTSDGGLAVTGWYSPRGGDLLLAKWSSGGTHLWTRSFGSTGHETAYSLVEADDAQLNVSAYTNSFGEGGYDLSLLDCESNGTTCLEDHGGPSPSEWLPTGQEYLANQWIPDNVYGFEWTDVTVTEPIPACTLVCPTPTVSIFYPGSSSDTAWGDHLYTIQWTPNHAEFAPLARLWFSYDAGATWLDSTGVIQNNGSYDWLVPCSTGSTDCRVRVCAWDEGDCVTACDTSVVFPLIVPTVIIQTPQDGEHLTACSTYQVTWYCDYADHYPVVKLGYSCGGPWQWILEIDNGGAYDWEVQCVASLHSCRLAICVGDNCSCDTTGEFTVSCCNHDGRRGDVNYDGSGPNIVDLTYLVANLFGGGDPPPCFEEGDVNADGNINIVDLTYLAARLFGGGAPPYNCDGTPPPGAN